MWLLISCLSWALGGPRTYEATVDAPPQTVHNPRVSPDGRYVGWLERDQGEVEVRIAPTSAPDQAQAVFRTTDVSSLFWFSGRPHEILVSLYRMPKDDEDVDQLTDAPGLLGVDVRTGEVRRLLDAKLLYDLHRTADPDVVAVLSREQVDRKTGLARVQRSDEAGIAEEIVVSDKRLVWRSRISRLRLSTRAREVVWESPRKVSQLVVDAEGQPKMVLRAYSARRWRKSPDEQTVLNYWDASPVREDGKITPTVRFRASRDAWAEIPTLATRRLHDGELFVIDGEILAAVDATTGESREAWAPEGAGVAWVDVADGALRWAAVDTDRWRYVKGPPAKAALVARFPEGAIPYRCDDAGLHCAVWTWSSVDRGTWYAWDVAAGRFTRLGPPRPAPEVPWRPMASATVPATPHALPVYFTTPDPDRFGSGPWPTVLQVHDGPARRDARGFSVHHQWLADHGYAVLSVNYRGSAGQGRAFRAAAEGEWGGGTHEDLIAALDWATAQGWVKPGAVAIRGEGFGGYSALRALTASPDRFACGIAGAASGSLLRRSGGGAWDYGARGPRAVRKARSPDEHVDRLAAPVLVWHGEADVRMPIGQVERFVERASAAGKSVTFVRYPEQGHRLRGTAAKAQAHLDARFLARCLGGLTEPVEAEIRSAGAQIEGGEVLRTE